MLAVVLLCAPVFAATDDVCKSVAKVTMVFVEPALVRLDDKKVEAYGIFKIVNNSKKPLVLAGERKNEGFVVRYPDAYFQALGADGIWEKLLYLVGSFAKPPDTLTIASGLSGNVLVSTYDATYYAQGKRNKASLKFRVVLPRPPNYSCVISTPFQLRE